LNKISTKHGEAYLNEMIIKSKQKSENKEQKILDFKRKKEYEELKECTFQPLVLKKRSSSIPPNFSTTISSNFSMNEIPSEKSRPLVINGIERFLELKRKAKDKEKEELEVYSFSFLLCCF
jgi:hypothetical protein